MVLEDLKLIDLGDIEPLGLEDFKLIEEEKIEDKPVDIIFNYKIEIDCNNEDSQKNLSQELEDRGFKVRLLI
jgi:hypothetical protein